MTKQNVVVSDCTSPIGKVRLAASNSALFSPAIPKTLAALGGRIAISKKKLMKRLDTRRGVKVSTWVDSMRDSSPTRTKSTPSLPETEEKSSWILRHPSALENFEQIISASKGKQIVMFLDYDGTLSPIVEDPDQAFMSIEMREAVRDVARYFPTAIVSGRCRDKVYNFVRLEELFYAGSHGMDIKGPSKHRKCDKGNQAVIFEAASEFLPMIVEVYKALISEISSVPGAKVENNKFCLSVHFRCVDEKSWAALAEQVRVVLSAYPKLKLTQGRKVLEIRPTIKWDKGKALEFLLESLGYANSNEVLPIYIGDDQTDEDAFKVLRHNGQGFGILVSRVAKETSASYSLKEPSEVKEFLRLLVEQERGSQKGQDSRGGRGQDRVNM